MPFLALAANSLVRAKFTNISELLAYLHSPRTRDYDWSDAGLTLSALVAARATTCDSELIHSILVLAFAPTIHRTYTEVCAWFRELEPEDIGQQLLAFFLELVASAATENLAGVLPIALSRSLARPGDVLPFDPHALSVCHPPGDCWPFNFVECSFPVALYPSFPGEVFHGM